MIYVELQILLVLYVNIIQELWAWHVVPISRTSCYLRTLKVVRDILRLIQSTLLFIMMNSIRPMHIPRIHPCTTLWIQICRQLHRSSLVSGALPWLTIILNQSTVDGECVSKLIFLWELFFALVVLWAWNGFWSLVLWNLLPAVVDVLSAC